MGKGRRNRNLRKEARQTFVGDLVSKCDLVVKRTDLFEKARNGENIGVTFEEMLDSQYEYSNTAVFNGFDMLRSLTGTHIKEYLESIKDDFKPLYNVEYNEFYFTSEDENLFHRFYAYFWETYWFILNSIRNRNLMMYTDDIEHDVLWMMLYDENIGGLDYYYKAFIGDECRQAETNH